MAEAGEQALDFELPGTAGAVRLSALFERKKVVLAFYAEDHTPLCSNEVAMLRDDYDVIQALGAEVIADSLESHSDFARRIGGLPFPLASDIELEAARAYGVVDEASRRSRRAVFVIDGGAQPDP